MRCLKPEVLTCGKDGKVCQVVIKCYRERSTGPEFPLMVVYCKVHKVHFTIYPPGYYPHGRTKLFPYGTSEEHQESTKEQTSGSTLFDSAMNSAWRKKYEYTGDTSWSTHRRRLKKSGKLLGLMGSESLGERISALLSIPLHVYKNQKKNFAKGTVSSEKKAVKTLIKAIPLAKNLWRLMHQAALLTGFAGHSWYWSHNRLLEALF
jgi:hypothetical protein